MWIHLACHGDLVVHGLFADPLVRRHLRPLALVRGTPAFRGKPPFQQDVDASGPLVLCCLFDPSDCDFYMAIGKSRQTSLSIVNLWDELPIRLCREPCVCLVGRLACGISLCDTLATMAQETKATSRSSKHAAKKTKKASSFHTWLRIRRVATDKNRGLDNQGGEDFRVSKTRPFR